MIIRHHKITIFRTPKETSSVLQLQRSVDGIPPGSPAQWWLCRNDQLRGHTGRWPPSMLSSPCHRIFLQTEQAGQLRPSAWSPSRTQRSRRGSWTAREGGWRGCTMGCRSTPSEQTPSIDTPSEVLVRQMDLKDLLKVFA